MSRIQYGACSALKKCMAGTGPGHDASISRLLASGVETGQSAAVAQNDPPRRRQRNGRLRLELGQRARDRLRGRRQRKHFQTKKAADSFRINLEGQLQAGTYRAAADKVTVQDACESFLEHCKGRNQRDERMTRKMLAVYRGHISNYILHPEHGVGIRKLSQLAARSVGEFRNRIRGNWCDRAHGEESTRNAAQCT
jgi:hypothetical protein